MSDPQFQSDPAKNEPEVAVQEPPPKAVPRKKKLPAKKPPQHLPPYKVLLHNDDVNDIDYVVQAICKITTLSRGEASLRTREADRAGVSLLLVTHKERAELYQEQFTSARLTVTIEPE